MEGGLFDRFVEESVYQLIESSMLELGWGAINDPAQPPITWRAEPYDLDEKIELNTLVVEMEVSEDEEHELGGASAIEDRHLCYADFYAKDMGIGRNVAGDIRGILRGKMPSIGRLTPTLPVYNFDLPTPALITTGVILEPRTERPMVFSRPWKGILFSTQFVVLVDPNEGLDLDV